MKTFKRILTCTVPLFISTFCLPISAHAIESNEVVVTTEAQAPRGVETTTTVVTKQSNTTEVNFELKSKLEDIHKQLSQFAKSEIDCNIDFKEGLVVFASLDQAVLDEVNTYCVNNGIDGALVQLVLIEPEKDTTVVTTIGTQTETTITTTTTNETTLPQTGYSNSYRWLVGLSSLMTVTGAGILIRTRKKEK